MNRTLVLANRVPFPVDDGWKRRTYHVLRAVASRGPVTLLSFHDGSAETVTAFEAAVPGLEVVTVKSPPFHRWTSLVLGMITRRPFLAWRVRSARYRDRVDELVRTRSFGLCIAELTHLHEYLQQVPAGCRRVIDTHNIDSLVLERYASHSMRGPHRRWYARHTSRKLLDQEMRAFAAVDEVWVCSEDEAAWIRRRVPAAVVRVVPNGVDTDFFRAPPDVRVRPERLVFFGRMDYHPNTDAVDWFAREILPLVRSRIPEARLQVVGPGTPPAIHSLAARVDGLDIVGAVDDLRPFVSSASSVVVPLRSGGGTRLKILEALALGRPVITTTVGAEGLAIEPGNGIILADSPTEFVTAIERFVNEPGLADQVGRAGRAAVSSRYDWRAIESAIATFNTDPSSDRSNSEPLRHDIASSSTSPD